MESRPSPSTKSGASLSISAAVTSSSWSASIINSLISSSRSCTAAAFPAEISLQIFGQATRGHAFTDRVVNEGANINVVLHLDLEKRWLRRQAPPWASFAEHGRRAADQHGRDVSHCPHRDVGCAALEAHRAVRRGARSLGENDQIAAAAHRRDAVFDQTRAVVVDSHISGGAQGAVGEGVDPERAFNDAVGALDQTHQKNNVDEGRILGKNEQTAPVELFQSFDFIQKHAERTHRAHDAAKSEANHVPRHGYTGLTPPDENVQQREHENAADTDRHKSQTCAEHAPAVRETTEHGASKANDADRTIAQGLHRRANKTEKFPDRRASCLLGARPNPRPHAN